MGFGGDLWKLGFLCTDPQGPEGEPSPSGTHLTCRLSLPLTLSPLVGSPPRLAQDNNLLLGPIITVSLSPLVSWALCNNEKMTSEGRAPGSRDSRDRCT